MRQRIVIINNQRLLYQNKQNNNVENISFLDIPLRVSPTALLFYFVSIKKEKRRKKLNPTATVNRRLSIQARFPPASARHLSLASHARHLRPGVRFSLLPARRSSLALRFPLLAPSACYLARGCSSHCKSPPREVSAAPRRNLSFAAISVQDCRRVCRRKRI